MCIRDSFSFDRVGDCKQIQPQGSQWSQAAGCPLLCHSHASRVRAQQPSALWVRVGDGGLPIAWRSPGSSSCDASTQRERLDPPVADRDSDLRSLEDIFLHVESGWGYLSAIAWRHNRRELGAIQGTRN